MMFLFPGKPEEEYRRQLGSFGVSGELALRPIDSLSGGQKSRVAFAMLAMLRYVITTTFSCINKQL
jgi:ATP-binding cassette subfamily F protein 3